MTFSILVPTYKKKYLQECIQSILAQTFSDFEIVIVNDASPEDIDGVISLFNDSRIRYYKNTNNSGAVDVVDNWNACLHYSHGEYVICMGDDDRLLPSCLEEYVQLIKRYPELRIYHTRTEIIDESSTVVDLQEARPVYESVFAMILGRWMGRKQYIGDFLFEAQSLKREGGFYKLPLAWGTDDISAYIAASAGGIANMQVAGFQYRKSEFTISAKGDCEMKLFAIAKEEEWMKSFLQQPVNTIYDSIYKEKLLDRLTSFYQYKRRNLLAEEIKHNGITSIKRILFKRKQLNVFANTFLFALLGILKVRINKQK